MARRSTRIAWLMAVLLACPLAARAFDLVRSEEATHHRRPPASTPPLPARP